MGLDVNFPIGTNSNENSTNVWSSQEFANAGIAIYQQIISQYHTITLPIPTKGIKQLWFISNQDVGVYAPSIPAVSTKFDNWISSFTGSSENISPYIISADFTTSRKKVLTIFNNTYLQHYDKTEYIGYPYQIVDFSSSSTSVEFNVNDIGDNTMQIRVDINTSSSSTKYYGYKFKLVAFY